MPIGRAPSPNSWYRANLSTQDVTWRRTLDGRMVPYISVPLPDTGVRTDDRGRVYHSPKVGGSLSSRDVLVNGRAVTRDEYGAFIYGTYPRR